MASFSRTLLLLSFLFMVIVVVSREVSARELAETSAQAGPISEDGYDGGHKCKYGKCCKGPHCHYGAAGETQATATVAHIEDSDEVVNTNTTHEDGYGHDHGHGHGHNGGGHKCKGPHCHHGAAEETQATATVAYTEDSSEVENTNAAHVDGYGHGHNGGGHKCKGPHCHHGADEETQATAMVANTEDSGEVENTNTAHVDGHGGGHKCKYGKCCKGPHCH